MYLSNSKKKNRTHHNAFIGQEVPIITNRLKSPGPNTKMTPVFWNSPHL